MANHWYYTHDDNKSGPFSDQQLRDLADAGQILRTDTIWKHGVEKGVAANKVKNLFPPADEAPAPDEAARPDTKVDHSSQSAPGTPPSETGSPATAEELPPSAAAESILAASSEDVELTPEENVPSPVRTPAPQQKQGPKRRAVAGKGVKIGGQDGSKVRIKKICTECGFEDSCWHSMEIRIGINKATFYCRKCRKSRQVEFQGFGR